MNTETGEIKEFENNELVTNDEGKKSIPIGWEGLPERGTEIEIIMPPNNRRGLMWKVVSYVEDTPGHIVLEPTQKTLKKLRKNR